MESAKLILACWKTADNQNTVYFFLFGHFTVDFSKEILLYGADMKYDPGECQSLYGSKWDSRHQGQESFCRYMIKRITCWRGSNRSCIGRGNMLPNLHCKWCIPCWQKSCLQSKSIKIQQSPEWTQGLRFNHSLVGFSMLMEGEQRGMGLQRRSKVRFVLPSLCFLASSLSVWDVYFNLSTMHFWTLALHCASKQWEWVCGSFGPNDPLKWKRVIIAACPRTMYVWEQKAHS